MIILFLCELLKDTYLKAEGIVMVWVTKISVVEEPDIADVEDLVVWAIKELGKILGWLKEISQPDHGWKITVSSLKELTSQLNLVVFLLVGSSY